MDASSLEAAGVLAVGWLSIAADMASLMGWTALCRCSAACVSAERSCLEVLPAPSAIPGSLLSVLGACTSHLTSVFVRW